MKASRKILFIKNSATGSFARSWVAEELGVHSRIIADAGLLGRILTAETFDIVLLDQRGSNEELIPSIEGMRRFQTTAKLLVVSDSVALSEVQQAIRFNVHDIFLPPFELMPIVERVDAIIAQLNNTPPTPAAKLLAHWSEVGATLAGQLDAIFIQEDRNVAGGAPEGARSAESQLLDLQQRIERQDAELTTLRAQVAEATEARARLNDQIVQLSAGASALGRAESRARALEAEVAELRRTGGGGVDIGPLRDELDKAQARIAELERLNTGLLAGTGGGGASDPASPELEERVRALEAELADANARFEAAGQAFATEMEQVMAREAEAMAALAAAEDRERKAQAVMATAGDAFGRADETLERERTEIRALRDEVTAAKAALEEERKALAQREARLATRTRRVDTLGQELAGDVERVIGSLGALTEHAQALMQRREELRSLGEK